MYTDFAAQTPQARLAWGHEAYKQFRDELFLSKYLGKGDDAIIEHVDELTTSPKGTTGAMLRLRPDIVGGGVTGDNQLRGRERRLEVGWQQIEYDQIRNGVVTKGEMAEMRSVIDTRTEGKDALARWAAETVEDQLMLMASGISFAFNLDGSVRSTPDNQDPWVGLDYAGYVRPPSLNRGFRWNAATGKLVPADTTQVASTDLPAYGMLTQLMAKAQRARIRPIKSNGRPYWLFLTTPEAIAAFYQDAAFRAIVTTAGVRGDQNPIFNGAHVTMHGLVIQDYNKVFNTLGAAPGSKWGAGGNVDGARSLLLGSQALALVDITKGMKGKAPFDWREEEDDYGNVNGIAVVKKIGMVQPQFYDPYTKTVEDFNRLTIDHAI